MTASATVVTDSISPQGIRLTTFRLRYPKFIHGEFLTHRDFSRNSSSSRAIPVERMIQDVEDDPAMPVFWGRNQPGMQAAEELDGHALRTTKTSWEEARRAAISYAKVMAHWGAHKQLVNRILEPWCHINTLVTSTKWANFFALRCHPDAQPEIRVLAEAMRDARNKSDPTLLQPGEWHLPYVSREDREANPHIALVKASVARCARVSYLTHDAKPPNIEDDMRLYDRLVGSTPLHASPAEHQATPDRTILSTEIASHWAHPELHGNFTGWIQYRKMLPSENVPEPYSI